MNIRSEQWHGHTIRFVEKEPGEWWAVAMDAAKALGFRDAYNATVHMPDKYKDTTKGSIKSGRRRTSKKQEMIIISEKGLYRLMMRSNKPEAEEFQDWVYDILKSLRIASGLEGFQVLEMTDAQHQRKWMDVLHREIPGADEKLYSKVNSIADKATSNVCGYKKMVKKKDMTPEMLKVRPGALEYTCLTEIAKRKRNLDISVSKQVYALYPLTLAQ